MRVVDPFMDIVLTKSVWSIHFGYFVSPESINPDAVTENHVGCCKVVDELCDTVDVVYTFV